MRDGSARTQMTEWALAAVSLAMLSPEEIVAYPMINMSTVPSETFGPKREVMSSGGTAEPTFHVTMWTLSEHGNQGNTALYLKFYCRIKEDTICPLILRGALIRVTADRNKSIIIKHLFAPQ